MRRGIGQTETEAAVELWQQVKCRKAHRHCPPPVLSDGWGGHREALVQVYGGVPDYQGRGRPPTIKRTQPGRHYTQMVKQRDSTGHLAGVKVRVIYGDETTLARTGVVGCGSVGNSHRRVGSPHAANAAPWARWAGLDGSERARRVKTGVRNSSSAVQIWSVSPNAIAGVRLR